VLLRWCCSGQMIADSIKECLDYFQRQTLLFSEHSRAASCLPRVCSAILAGGKQYFHPWRKCCAAAPKKTGLERKKD
jgi:hypothetical protein